MTQLHDLTALEQAAAVRAGEVSPTELVEHCLARIDALDAGLGAFVTVTPVPALDAATAAEELLARGGDLPPLLGVPTAVKDLTNTAGVRTTFGSGLYSDFVPPVDDVVVTRLAAAGRSAWARPTPLSNECPARCPQARIHRRSWSGGAVVATVGGEWCSAACGVREPPVLPASPRAGS